MYLQMISCLNVVVISLALGAGMLGVFVLMAAITAALCYRMKRITLKGDFVQLLIKILDTVYIE